MSTNEAFPAPPEELLHQSDEWAYDRSLELVRDNLDSFTKVAYYKSFVIYQQHRANLVRCIEAAGGPVCTAYVKWGERGVPYENVLACQDGTIVELTDLVAMEPITTELAVPSGLPESTTRTHEIQVSYGGNYIGGRKAEEVFGLESKWLHDAKPFETLLQDPAYFPEDIGITERIVIDLHEPFDPGKKYEEPHVDTHSFTLDGKIWRPASILDTIDIPNPHTDPLAYRRWALAGDAKLEVTFQALATNIGRDVFNDERIEYSAMKTIIDRGRIVTDKSTLTPREAVEKFRHYLGLLDFCYVHYIPEEDRRGIDEELAELLGRETLALPSGVN